MKYVRTKDGMLGTNPYDCIVSSYTLYDVEKEADTIEELCDEFVISYIDGFHQLASFPSKVEVMLGHSVYGAIRTDKGLIYVAKMNDKGEFELL